MSQAKPEGPRKRTYAPKRDCIRAKLLQFFADNPQGMIGRDDARERYGCTLASLEYAVTMLKRDGHIKSLYGPHRTTYYLKGDSPVVRLPKPARVRKDPAVIRHWPETSSYVEPRPIPISVFEWRP